MNVQEIRERLEKYNKGRVTGSVRVVGSFADWMAEELERQLDRNHELDKQLTGIKAVGEPVLRDIEAYASTLQRMLCCYRSVQGPGLEPSGRCDCKFDRGDGLTKSETTGCCESRQIILLSRRLAEALDKIEEMKG